jgi:hypothetical protein
MDNFRDILARATNGRGFVTSPLLCAATRDACPGRSCATLFKAGFMPKFDSPRTVFGQYLSAPGDIETHRGLIVLIMIECQAHRTARGEIVVRAMS